MVLPKRIELWVLGAMAMMGIILVFTTRHRDDETDASTAGATTTSSEAPLKLHRCSLERDLDHVRLDLELQVRNSSGEKLPLQPPKARLLGAKGREIPGFYLPFEQPPEIPPMTTQDVQLRYWLDEADLQGAIQLEVEGKTVEVKSAKPFDLNTLKNGEKKTFNAGEW